MAVVLEREYATVSEGAMWVNPTDPNPAARITGLSATQRFAVAHAAFHGAASNAAAAASASAAKWFTDFHQTYWLVAVGVGEAGNAGLARVLRDADEVVAVAATSKNKEEKRVVELTRDFLTRGVDALVNDPRELAGQVMGRCGAPPLFFEDVNKKRAWEAAEAWVSEATESGVDVLTPVGEMSGLAEVGSMMERVFVGHDSCVAAVAISPDGKTAVTASWDNTARVWDLATGKTVKVLEGHTLVGDRGDHFPQWRESIDWVGRHYRSRVEFSDGNDDHGAGGTHRRSACGGHISRRPARCDGVG